VYLDVYRNGTLTHERQAHSHAFNKAKILHRDISAGNIILTDEGKGLLIDWELAKMMGKGGRRRPDRTVNRSAHTVRTSTDDCELT
jgi:serine/threonine protein kinase